MFMSNRTIAVAIGLALLNATQAFAIDTKQTKKATTNATQKIEKLEISIQVSTNIRPMTTQEDIANQLLGPRLLIPIAENLTH